MDGRHIEDDQSEDRAVGDEDQSKESESSEESMENDSDSSEENGDDDDAAECRKCVAAILYYIIYYQAVQRP